MIKLISIKATYLYRNLRIENRNSLLFIKFTLLESQKIQLDVLKFWKMANGFDKKKSRVVMKLKHLKKASLKTYLV